jgi:hypothetical protein
MNDMGVLSDTLKIYLKKNKTIPRREAENAELLNLVQDTLS